MNGLPLKRDSEFNLMGINVDYADFMVVYNVQFK